MTSSTQQTSLTALYEVLFEILDLRAEALTFGASDAWSISTSLDALEAQAVKLLAACDEPEHDH